MQMCTILIAPVDSVCSLCLPLGQTNNGLFAYWRIVVHFLSWTYLHDQSHKETSLPRLQIFNVYDGFFVHVEIEYASICNFNTQRAPFGQIVHIQSKFKFLIIMHGSTHSKQYHLIKKIFFQMDRPSNLPISMITPFVLMD